MSPHRALVAALPFAAATLLLLWPGSAHGVSGIPDPARSTIGTGIVLCGTTGGVPDPLATKTIVVFDTDGDPVAGCTVTIGFWNCVAAEMRLCDTQPYPGTTVNCTDMTVSALTDLTGTVRFRVVGYALNGGGGTPGAPYPGYGAGGATVRAGTVTLGTLIVASPDENGTGGVNTVDLALWLNDRFSTIGPASFRGRSDLNGSGSIDPVDLAMLLRYRGDAGSTASCAVPCPLPR